MPTRHDRSAAAASRPRARVIKSLTRAFGLLAVLAGALAAPSVAAAHCLEPSHLTIKVTASTAVTAHWTTPKQWGRLSFRVLRDRRVVAQTTRHSMRVPVVPGKRHKIAVGIVRPGGLAPLCYAHTTVKTSASSIQPFPTVGAPQLAVLSTGGDEVTVSWLRIPEAGAYRVERDGAVVNQTRSLSITIPVAAGRVYAVRVAAVSRAGRLGRWSKALSVDLGHQPPGTPSGLELAGTTLSSLTVNWGAATPGSAPVQAYRVYKNGAVVGQSTNTSMTLGGLAPERSYQVEVVAVDAQGYLSAPSPAITATTAPPEKSAGQVRLFVLADTQASIDDFKAHYLEVSTIYPTYFECNGQTGTFTGNDNAPLDQFAVERGIQVLPRLDCQGTALVHSMLTNPTMRANAIQSAVALVQTYHYNGVDLDFEAGAASDRALFTQFVTDLAQAIHNVGGTVSVDASPKTSDVQNHPRSTFFDYIGLSQVADEILVMSWGLHWSTSAPGSDIDIRWFSRVYQYVASLPNHDRFVMGVPLYALDWPNGGGPSNPATALSWSALQSVIAATGPQPQLDPASDEWYFNYTDSRGVPHQVWFTTPQTLEDHFALAADDGLAGIALWRAGQEDPAVWNDAALNTAP